MPKTFKMKGLENLASRPFFDVVDMAVARLGQPKVDQKRVVDCLYAGPFS